MGLVARALEAEGISTIVLSPTPEFTREIGIPRTAAIEYPYGRPLGEVNDPDGQRKVLMDTLKVLAEMEYPGKVTHLPYEWHELPKDTKWHPPEISPLIKLYLDEIKQMGAALKKK